MTRAWVIVVAVIAAFLIYSVAGYFRDSSKLHEEVRAAEENRPNAAVRSNATKIDETWLARELPRLKSEDSVATGAPAGKMTAPAVETTATIAE